MKIYEAISIDKNASDPLYIQVYEGIRNLISNGVIKHDEKLPPIRVLADRLGVNNVTIVSAYKLLEQKGCVISKVGSGTFVRSFSQENESDIQSEIDSIEQGYVTMGKSEINFLTSTPDPKLFPVEAFKLVLNEVLDRDGGNAFGYQESQGFLPLRESVRDYLCERGMNIDTNDIHVISGAQQGIDIVSKALLEFNDNIIVESPTYTGAIAAFKSRGANIIEIPLMKDGMDMRELEDVLKSTQPKLIYVMTSYQNPTGISYSDDKKLQLIYLANKYNTFILEDDYLSEMRFDGGKTLPLKSIDDHKNVIYLKSFSKIFMPGIRMAFLASPKKLTSRFMKAKHNTDISTSSLMQRALDLYLKNGMWSEHLKLMMQVYSDRYGKIVNALSKYPDTFSFTRPEGGIHMWLDTKADSAMVCSLAKQKGVLASPGSIFYLDGRKSTNIRLSFAGVESDEIENGIKLLAEACNEVLNINSESILPFL